jgi:hypothetical protein
MILIVLYNPFGLFSDFKGTTIFVALFLAMFFVTMIVFYDYLFKNPNSMNVPKNLSTNIFFISFAFLLSGGVIVFCMWLFGLFGNKPDTSMNASSIGSFVINFLLLFVMLAIVYKLFTMTNITKSPLGRVILYSIFYIPCLFVNVNIQLSPAASSSTQTLTWCVIGISVHWDRRITLPVPSAMNTWPPVELFIGPRAMAPHVLACMLFWRP